MSCVNTLWCLWWQVMKRQCWHTNSVMSSFHVMLPSYRHHYHLSCYCYRELASLACLHLYHTRLVQCNIKEEVSTRWKQQDKSNRFALYLFYMAPLCLRIIGRPYSMRYISANPVLQAVEGLFCLFKLRLLLITQLPLTFLLFKDTMQQK